VVSLFRLLIPFHVFFFLVTSSSFLRGRFLFIHTLSNTPHFSPSTHFSFWRFSLRSCFFPGGVLTPCDPPLVQKKTPPPPAPFFFGGKNKLALASPFLWCFSFFLFVQIRAFLSTFFVPYGSFVIKKPNNSHFFFGFADCTMLVSCLSFFLFFGFPVGTFFFPVEKTCFVPPFPLCALLGAPAPMYSRG